MLQGNIKNILTSILGFISKIFCKPTLSKVSEDVEQGKPSHTADRSVKSHNYFG